MYGSPANRRFAETTARRWWRQLSRRVAVPAAGLALAAVACSPGGDADRPLAAASTGAQDSSASPTGDVRPGIEVLLSDSLALVRGRRVGLITNHTGRDRGGTPSIDLLAAHPEVELVSLYSPEHGIRGSAEAGVRIEGGLDEHTGLPVHSLYGDTRTPTDDMLDGVEVLLFDIQDVGARYYTYLSTMALAMEAAGELGIPFVVLDRPNPIGGDPVQGNVLDPEFSSFVGLYPIPMRHGLTAGEFARMAVGGFGVRVELSVAVADGWERTMPFRRDRDSVGCTVAKHAVGRECASLPGYVPVRGDACFRRAGHRPGLSAGRRPMAGR